MYLNKIEETNARYIPTRLRSLYTALSMHAHNTRHGYICVLTFPGHWQGIPMALGFIVLTRLSGSGLMVDCIRHESGLSLEPLAGTIVTFLCCVHATDV